MYYSLLFRIIRRGNSKKSSYSWPQNTQPLAPDTPPDNIANLVYKVSEFGVLGMGITNPVSELNLDMGFI